MAGGTWIDQNKVRPGVYINYKSKPASLAQMGERGTVAIAWLSDWVETHKFYTIEDVSDCEKLGHAISDDEMLFVRQILKGTNRTAGASKILVYTLSGTGAAKATATTGGVVATAKNNGAFGNNLSVSVTGSAAPYVVHTFLKGTEVDAQQASQVSDLVSNDYVDFLEGGGGGNPAKAHGQFNDLTVEAVDSGELGNSLYVRLSKTQSGSSVKVSVGVVDGLYSHGNFPIAIGTQNCDAVDVSAQFLNEIHNIDQAPTSALITFSGSISLSDIPEASVPEEALWIHLEGGSGPSKAWAPKDGIAVKAAEAGEDGNNLRVEIYQSSDGVVVDIYDSGSDDPETPIFTSYNEIISGEEGIYISDSTFNEFVDENDNSVVITQYVTATGDITVPSENDSENPIVIQLSGGSNGAATSTFGPGVLTALTGGSNGTAASSEYAAFLTALEPEKFDVVICDSSDASIKASYCDFVKRLSNDEGQRCQAVVSNLANDSECVISVYNQTVTLNDGTELDSQKLTWWVGGASAGANVNESLTYASHPDAVDVSPKLTASQQESAINSGHIAFISQFGKIQILTDINTFTTFSTNKGRAFRKNRVVRTVFGLCNDIYKTFALYHIGVTDNNDDGRAALKGEILDLMSRYEGNRALQNVNPDDVTVIKGIDSDAVVIEVYCQPVDSIEKIYVNITIS